MTITRSFLVWVWGAALLAGCASDSGQRPPAATPGAVPDFQRGSIVVAVTVDGPHADLGKSGRCIEILERHGVVVRPDAQIMAQLTLFEGRHYLRIFRRLSQSDFQLLRQGPKPDWSMGELCTDMIREIVAAVSGPPLQPPPGGMGVVGGVQGGVPNVPRTEAPPPSMGPRAGVELQLLPPATALPPGAQALAANAEGSYRSGDFARAHAAYAEAHRQSGDVNLLFDLGLCYVKLGRNAEGLKFLQLYLDRAPNAPNRGATEQKLIELRHLLGDDD